MKLVSLNIECNKHYEKFIPFLKEQNPDVICLQEVLEEDFVFLQEKIGLPGIFKAHAYVTSNHENYRDLCGKRFGVAIFTQTVIDSGYSFYWGKEENIAVSFEEYAVKKEELQSYVLLWVDIQDKEGKTFRCVTTHYPVSKEGEASTHQLEVLTPFFEHLERLQEFVICGDFNAPRGNETFTRIAKKYKDNIPEKYVTSLDQNFHRMKDLMFMVDCLFTTPQYNAKEVSLTDGLSDHMAIVATITRV